MFRYKGIIKNKNINFESDVYVPISIVFGDKGSISPKTYYEIKSKYGGHIEFGVNADGGSIYSLTLISIEKDQILNSPLFNDLVRTVIGIPVIDIILHDLSPKFEDVFIEFSVYISKDFFDIGFSDKKPLFKVDCEFVSFYFDKDEGLVGIRISNLTIDVISAIKESVFDQLDVQFIK